MSARPRCQRSSQTSYWPRLTPTVCDYERPRIWRGHFPHIELDQKETNLKMSTVDYSCNADRGFICWAVTFARPFNLFTWKDYCVQMIYGNAVKREAVTNISARILSMPPRQHLPTYTTSKSRRCIKGILNPQLFITKPNHRLLYGSFSPLNRSAAQYRQHVQPAAVEIPWLMVEGFLHLPLIAPSGVKHAGTNSIYNINRHLFRAARWSFTVKRFQARSCWSL